MGSKFVPMVLSGFTLVVILSSVIMVASGGSIIPIRTSQGTNYLHLLADAVVRYRIKLMKLYGERISNNIYFVGNSPYMNGLKYEIGKHISEIGMNINLRKITPKINSTPSSIENFVNSINKGDTVIIDPKMISIAPELVRKGAYVILITTNKEDVILFYSILKDRKIYNFADSRNPGYSEKDGQPYYLCGIYINENKNFIFQSSVQLP